MTSIMKIVTLLLLPLLLGGCATDKPLEVSTPYVDSKIIYNKWVGPDINSYWYYENGKKYYYAGHRLPYYKYGYKPNLP
jgi:hypothetical protein